MLCGAGAAALPLSQADVLGFVSVALSLLAPWSMTAYVFLLCFISSVIFGKASGSLP